MKSVRFGIIGCGLMGREFASAAARWCHLTAMTVRPQIVAVCNTSPAPMRWFTDHFPDIRQATADYRELLANPDVDAVYVAVPHHLHAEIYCAAIRAGKHLLGEKPFGIDREANAAILACLAEHPACFARCSSEFPFFPAMQRIGKMIEADAFGRIIEVNAGFQHSSDLDPAKPLNWKRRTATNGDYGCMGDLGMHTLHVPLRAGWTLQNVRAILTKIYPQRPGADGAPTPCETWDNATLLCEAADRRRIRSRSPSAPNASRRAKKIRGASRSWARAAPPASPPSRPIRLQLLDYTGGEQAWQHLDMGHEMTFPTITGGIFEAGFSDIFLQMWAAYLVEMEQGAPPARFAGCVTPEETRLHHQVLSAALDSHHSRQVADIGKFAHAAGN